jgi:hypothetical protein
MLDAHWFRSSFLAVPLLVSLVGQLAAQSDFSEPFDYSPPGADLMGQAGGSGFAGAWFASGFNASIHNNYDVAADSLSFQDLAATGSRMETAATNAIAGLGRNLAAPIAAGATTTVYFSLLVRPEGMLGQGAFNGFFGAYLDGTGNADLFVGKPGSAVVGRYVIENRGGAGQVQSGVAPVVGETVLLVVRAELRPGADVFTLYVNPDPCEPEPGSGTVKSDLDLGDVSAVVIYSTGAFSLDELRLGSSFEDVVRAGIVTCPASEPCEYSPPGADLMGQAGGTGFAGAWFASGFNASIHNNYDVAADSLSFQELVVTGNRTETAATNAIAGLGRNLAVPIAAGAAATVYFSLLLRPEGMLGQGALNGFFGAYLDGTGNADLFVGKPGSAVIGRYVIENRGGAGQVQSGVAPVVGETVLLVVRAELRPGADVFTLYVNPDPCEPEPGSGTVKSDLDLGDVSALVIYSTGAFSLDELRLGPSFEEVLQAGGIDCTPIVDCNLNGIADHVDIRSGFSEDLNGNRIPDECEPPPAGAQVPSDCNQDGVLDLSDGVCLLNFLFLGTLRRLPCGNGEASEPGNVSLLDANGDGQLDLSDASRVFGFLFLGQQPPVLGTDCTDIVGCPMVRNCP